MLSYRKFKRFKVASCFLLDYFSIKKEIWIMVELSYKIDSHIPIGRWSMKSSAHHSSIWSIYVPCCNAIITSSDL